jgi:uncharacterized GH25 family protein
MTSCLRFLFTILVSGAPLLAHDMWIEPATFSPQTGDIVGVKLRVGQDLLGDPLPRDPKLIKSFVVEDAEGRKPLVGRTGADPAGYLRITAPGMHVVGYSSNPSQVELGAEKFNQYLKDEGLDQVAAMRAKRNETGTKVRELFSRCAKSLVLAGPPSESSGDRTLGCALELVAERNPYALHARQTLPLILKYENRPLAGALVVAINRLNPAQKLTARTGKDGRVRFTPRDGGLWLIKAVHMVPAETEGSDWVSYWASLTFELGARK